MGRGEDGGKGSLAPLYKNLPLTLPPTEGLCSSLAIATMPPMSAVATSPKHLVGSANPTSKFSIYAEKVLEALRLGNTFRASCLQVGLNPETGHSWRYEGRKNPEKYPEYANWNARIEEIMAEVQAEMVDVVRNTALSGAPNTWQAAAWYLERTDPEHWSKRDKVTVQNEGAPLVQINQVILGDDDAREASRELLHRLTAGRTAEPLGPGSRGELAESVEGDGRLGVLDVDPR